MPSVATLGHRHSGPARAAGRHMALLLLANCLLLCAVQCPGGLVMASAAAAGPQVDGAAPATGDGAGVSQSVSCHAHVGDLTGSTFNATLAQLPLASVALIEFYATWCPACSWFAPQYEAIGKHFSTTLVAGHRVHVYRVDCAHESALCASFAVGAFPSILFGDVLAFRYQLLHELDTIDSTSSAEPAAEVINWVARSLRSDVVYVPPALQPPASASLPLDTLDASLSAPAVTSNASLTWPASAWLQDAEASTVQLLDIIAQSTQMHTGADKRGALATLLSFFAASHPSPRCRRGASDLLARLGEVWPADVLTPNADALAQHQVCGEDYRFHGWVACKSGVEGARGFPCGLWYVLHGAAARVDEARGGAAFMSALRAFNTHFFQCSYCQRHMDKVLALPAAAAVRSRRDAVAWIWEAHNDVNRRLVEVERRYGHSTSGDPAYPKVQWPTREVCPACWRGELEGDPHAEQPAWDMDEVAAFLTHYFAVTELDGASKQQHVGVGAGAAQSKPLRMQGGLPQSGRLRLGQCNAQGGAHGPTTCGGIA